MTNRVEVEIIEGIPGHPKGARRFVRVELWDRWRKMGIARLAVEDPEEAPKPRPKPAPTVKKKRGRPRGTAKKATPKP